MSGLAPMSPPPVEGLRVFCAMCGASSEARHVLCDLEDAAGTYYCPGCVNGLQRPAEGLLTDNADLAASSTWEPPQREPERPELPGREHLAGVEFPPAGA